MRLLRKKHPFRWVVRTFGCAALLLAVWGYGLLAFVDRISETADNADSRTEAIVILTGGSERLSSAIELLNQGKAEKLFISGVGKGASLETMLILSGPLPDNIAQLVDNIHLGYEAENTRGNAEETAKWMKENHYDSLRLVTANYHTPRSVLEFRKYMPDVKLVVHPVFPEHVILDKWWQSDGSKKLLISEYNKYLASKLRSFVGA